MTDKLLVNYNSENLEESEFSLSKSNMEFGSASMKIDVDDTAECSFSNVLGMTIIGEMSPERIQRCHKYTSGSC